jgi:phage/conjugal plasmid C-4 type zinc finger TraR family protein
MDAADAAQEQEAVYLGNQLARQQRRAALDMPGNALCADCAEPIPEARRRAMPSATRCISCQAWAEQVARIPA